MENLSLNACHLHASPNKCSKTENRHCVHTQYVDPLDEPSIAFTPSRKIQVTSTHHQTPSRQQKACQTNSISTSTTTDIDNSTNKLLESTSTQQQEVADSSQQTQTKHTTIDNLKHRWHHCPELHKAIDGVTYIADHTKKEEESTRVMEHSCSINRTIFLSVLFCSFPPLLFIYQPEAI